MPDSSLVASCSDDKSVKLWNVEELSLIQTLEGHTSQINGLCLSADGKLVASCSSDKTIKIRNIESS